jgi:signal transduction histidine kinase
MEFKNILLFIVSLITAYLSLFIIRGKKDYSSKVFSLFILAVGMWAFGVSFFYIAGTVELTAIFAKFYYTAAAAIPIFFLLFSFSFPNNAPSLKKVQLASITLLGTMALSIIFVTNFIIKDIHIGEPKMVQLHLPTYYTFFAYFVLILITAYLRLIRTYTKEKDAEVKTQLKILILGTIIPYIGGMVFNLVLPLFTYDYIWVGPLFGMIVVLVVLYAVYKHKLFDTKVLTAEMFTFTLWIFIFIRALIAEDTKEKIINIGLFALTVGIGLFLIRSVRKEVSQKEKLEQLAKELEATNIHLQELDQQKSEFVSLASHQLRGPLTAIKGYASMLLDGDFGPIEGEVKDAITKVYASTNDLVVLVGDYLDVSRIEQGRMQYDFSTFDLRDLAGTVVTELRPNIEKAKLQLDFDYDSEGEFRVNADQGKIKQVVSNLIDNSVKYTPKGSIHVWIAHTRPGKVTLSISDTGVGIHPDVLPRLFEKFTRAPDASKTNIMGTGLGLYVAKKMIEAHHGRIWAESAGVGKGSSFFIELDTV